MSQYREVVELLPCYLGLVAQRGRGDGPLQIQFQLKGTDRGHALSRGRDPYPYPRVSSSNLSAICQTVMTSTVRVDARGARGAQGASKGGGVIRCGAPRCPVVRFVPLLLLSVTGITL